MFGQCALEQFQAGCKTRCAGAEADDTRFSKQPAGHALPEGIQEGPCCTCSGPVWSILPVSWAQAWHWAVFCSSSDWRHTSCGREMSLVSMGPLTFIYMTKIYLNSSLLPGRDTRAGCWASAGQSCGQQETGPVAVSLRQELIALGRYWTLGSEQSGEAPGVGCSIQACQCPYSPDMTFLSSCLREPSIKLRRKDWDFLCGRHWYNNFSPHLSSSHFPGDF